MADPLRWFLDTPDPKKGVSQIFKESSVQSFIDAPEFYADLRKEIEFTTTNPSNGWFFWIGFEASGETWMPSVAPAPADKKPYSPISMPAGALALLDLLKAADAKGVRLRAMLNLHPFPSDKVLPKKYEVSNLKLAQTINATFKNAFVINDFRYLLMNGTHHQKLFIVNNSQRFSAYSGGLDLALNRIQDCWSDFHCRFQGDAVSYFYQLFRDRWKEHFKSPSKDIGFDASMGNLPDLSPHGGATGGFLCQVTTTYGNAGRSNPFGPIPGRQPPRQMVNRPHAITISQSLASPPVFFLLSNPPPLWIAIPVLSFGNDFFRSLDPAAPKLLEHAVKQDPTYSFAPDGHHAIYDAIAHCIGQAKRHIYLEDQYLVCDMPMNKLRSMMDVLKAKLGEDGFERLVVFSTRIDEINHEFQQTGWKHRSNIINTLLSTAKRPGQVVFCQYKSNRQLKRNIDPLDKSLGKSPFYVHSKTWIFDDELLISGSANCNRRGYSHDSELDFAICSSTTDFVKQTRIRLWRRRLFTEGFKGSKPPTDAELADFDSACRYWLKPSDYTADIESTAESGTQPFEPVDFKDATESELVTYVSLALPRIPGLIIMLNISLNDFLWDNVVDPEGT